MAKKDLKYLEKQEFCDANMPAYNDIADDFERQGINLK